MGYRIVKVSDLKIGDAFVWANYETRRIFYHDLQEPVLLVKQNNGQGDIRVVKFTDKVSVRSIPQSYGMDDLAVVFIRDSKATKPSDTRPMPCVRCGKPWAVHHWDHALDGYRCTRGEDAIWLPEETRLTVDDADFFAELGL